MKIKTTVAVAMVSVASFFSIADQGDTLISFCTPGPDKYADGQVVEEDEWYAICWSPDDVFDGLTTACEPVHPDEELILAAPLAKGGKCPMTYFQFARKDKYATGKFSILLLDTRNAGGKPAASDAYGRPMFVNAVDEVAAVAPTASKMCVDVSAPTAVSGAAAKQAVLPVDTELAPAKIAAITITGANVQLTVSPFDESVNYVIKTGTLVNDLNDYAIKVPAATSSGDDSGVNSATFIIPMEKGNFFTVGSVVK